MTPAEWGVVLIGVLLFALFVYNLWLRWQLRRQVAATEAAQAYGDDMALKNSRQRKVAQDVVPYLAQTSVAAFYNEANGVQRNFAQRQELVRATQLQNDRLRAFQQVFDVTPARQAVAVTEPLTSQVVELGPDAVTPAAGFPWRPM